MAILNCNSTITQTQILVSSALPNDDSSPSISRPAHLNPNTSYKKIRVKLKRKQEQQPSIFETERAIGAGIFRDRDIDSESEEKTSLYDNVVRNTVGKNEGSVEKKLRETGEWLVDQSDRTSRSAGKQILMTMFVWVIPLWISAFLIASGILQLPFSTPFLQDLIS